MDLDIGQKVNLHTKKGDFSCVILESPRSDIVLVKLDSGYNIGVREEDILDVKKIRDKKTEAKEFKIKSNKDKPNVAMVITGGTISSRLDSKTGAAKWLTDPAELLSFYPEILEICNIKKIEVPFMKASENMDNKDWKEISEVVAKLLNDSTIEGVIVTQGTDFLHYTAASLSFSLGKLNKPVVLTYSQRSSDRASSDARLNLQCAARMAISDVAEVSLVGHANDNDEFCFALPGTKARKMHSSRRDAFRPINTKELAKVYPDKVEVTSEYNPRNNKNKVSVNSNFKDKVALIKFHPGMEVGILDYYIENNYKGIIFEGSGLGHLATSESKNNLIPKLKKAIQKGIFVGITTQTLYGRVDPFVYSAGRELQKTGVVFLKDMLPETAFVKLSWVLGDNKLKKNIKESMLTNFSREFNEIISEKEFLN